MAIATLGVVQHKVLSHITHQGYHMASATNRQLADKPITEDEPTMDR